MVAAEIADTQVIEVEKEVLPNDIEDSLNDLSAPEEEAEIAKIKLEQQVSVVAEAEV